MWKGVLKTLKSYKIYDVLNILLFFLVDFAGFKAEGNVSFNCEPWKEV